MADSNEYAMRALQIAAYVVIVAWGIKAASHILSIVLIALLLAYAILPFPKWLMRRFRARKSLAMVLTVVFVAAVYLVLSLVLFDAGMHLGERLPIYEEGFRTLFEPLSALLSKHGIPLSHESVGSVFSSQRIIEVARLTLPEVIGLFSDRFLISLLSLIFIVKMADPDDAETAPLVRNLAYYGGDVQRFISITAETGAINALANFVLLLVLGVDFPVVWCVLYFFLHFIPNFGFLLSLVPPTLMALLVLGWKRALVVLGGLILTEMLGDYVLQPMLMIKGLKISLLQIMLSLIVWGFLLGPAGAILAVPLTLALRRFISRPRGEGEPSHLPQESG